MLEKNIQTQANEKIYLVDLFECQRIQFPSIKLINLIKAITGVFPITFQKNNKKIQRVYGEFEQVEFSLYLYDYFSSAIEQEIKRLRKAGEKIDKRSFTLGLIEEIEKKLNQEINATALQIASMENKNKDKALRLDIKSKIKSKSYSISNVNMQSMEAGSSFGKTIDIPQKIKKRRLN